MKNEQQMRARVNELEGKPDLTADEDAELSELRKRLQGVSSADDLDEVAVTVRFPSSVWDGLSSVARDERMSKNAAVIRAVEQFAGKHDGAAQEIGGLAQALAVLDENVCPGEHAATRKAYGRALARNYGVAVEDNASETRPKNGNGLESEDDPESDEQLRKQYRFYEDAVGKLPWMKQHSRRFRSFGQFRDANPADRRAEFKRLGVAEPWTPIRSSDQKKTVVKRATR